MNHENFIVNNLIDNLSTSKIISYLIENHAFNEDILKLELLKAVLVHSKPDYDNNNLVCYFDDRNIKTSIKYLVLNYINSDRINGLKVLDGNTIHIILYNTKSFSKSNIETLLYNLKKQLDVDVNYKIFKYFNGEIGILFFSSKQTNAINQIEKNVQKRTRISLPTGTYSKVLLQIKDSLNENDSIKFYDLMYIFRMKIEDKLKDLQVENPNINIEEEIKIFEQKYHTGAKRSQILLHTVNEKNRIYFRNIIPSKFDLFVYDPYLYPKIIDVEMTPLNDRYIKSFNPLDDNNQEVDIYIEKGKEPMKLKDLKMRYFK